MAVEIPVLLKHMSVRIYAKGYGGGTKTRQLVTAFNVARGKLAEWGYLTSGSAKGPLSEIKLTGKGASRDVRHRKEAGGSRRTAAFDLLYADLLAAYDFRITQEAIELPAGSRNMRDAQRKANVAKAAFGAPKAKARQSPKRRVKAGVAKKATAKKATVKKAVAARATRR